MRVITADLQRGSFNFYNLILSCGHQKTAPGRHGKPPGSSSCPLCDQDRPKARPRLLASPEASETVDGRSCWERTPDPEEVAEIKDLDRLAQLHERRWDGERLSAEEERELESLFARYGEEDSGPLPRTPTKRKTREPDETAAMLAAMELPDIYQFAAAILDVEIGDLECRYQRLNPGLQRMNLGNRIRSKLAK